MKVVVTGAAGMIGSNLVHGLNAIGIDDIIAVDDLTDGRKYRNLLGARIADYFDRGEFYVRFARGEFGPVDVVLHQGACSDTMEHNGQIMLQQNYRCTKDLLGAAQAQGTRLIYASSAATYGRCLNFDESSANEAPLNIYGWSKLLADQAVRRMLPSAICQVVGLRYFNVYGPREQHKARMASIVFQLYKQFSTIGKVRLFGRYGGFGPGEQARDFLHVDDVEAANQWFLQNPSVSGVFNLGSGRAQTFNHVAMAVINGCRALEGAAELAFEEIAERKLVEYIDIPPALSGHYQCYTQADLSRFRRTGCDLAFTDLTPGVSRYVAWLAAQRVD